MPWQEAVWYFSYINCEIFSTYDVLFIQQTTEWGKHFSLFTSTLQGGWKSGINIMVLKTSSKEFIVYEGD
jgi:hypothetical protein